MRNVYEVLKEKQCAIERIGREIEALRLVSTLLADEPDLKSSHPGLGVGAEAQVEMVSQQGNAADRRVSSPVAEKEGAFAKIRAQLLEVARNDIKKRSARNILLQFRHVAMGASRKLLRRVLSSRLWEHEPRPESEPGWMEAKSPFEKSA